MSKTPRNSSAPRPLLLLCTALALCASMALAGCDSISLPFLSSSQSSSSSQDSQPQPPSGGTLTAPGASSAPEQTYAKGTVTETEYLSEFWGIRFLVPENAGLLTEQQIKELLQVGGGAFGTDDALLSDADSKVSELYEMMASNFQTGSSLTVMTQPLSAPGLTADMVLRGIVAGIGTVGPEGGIELLNEGEPEEITLAELPFKKVSYRITVEGQPTTVMSQYVYVRGKYALVLAAGYGDALEGGELSCQALLDSLKPHTEE